MSLFRTALRPSAFTARVRQYATEAPKKKSNLVPMTLAVGGLGGLAYYTYATRSGAVPVALPSALNPEEFVSFTLKKVVPYNHNSSTFIFELPPKTSSKLPVASCVVVQAAEPEALQDKKGKPVIRPYTPISSADNTGELVFLIKKYETGVMSKYIHELKPGDSLKVKGPISKFPYKENEFDEVALIGGGSGIPANTTKFKLLFSNVTEEDILMREDLDALAKKHPKHLELVYLLDKPKEGWQGPKGYISADVIKKYVAPPTAERTMVMICGPPGQVAAIAGKKAGFQQGEIGGVLKELGYTADQVFKF
ncbi:NADH-cytochrome b5 reductase [Mycena sanguinolenta]|uniref:cytochrome-b5 reductase n=1 Tax=Mycena sanguinolenta TaxID=230812 RepID=A0A8H6XAB2_9AGAR|nr:NADH-cytochrome b5 reductase [Mycena sanguinolenta]